MSKELIDSLVEKSKKIEYLETQNKNLDYHKYLNLHKNRLLKYLITDIVKDNPEIKTYLLKKHSNKDSSRGKHTKIFINLLLDGLDFNSSKLSQNEFTENDIFFVTWDILTGWADNPNY